MTLRWHPFTPTTLPPIGPDLLLCTANPLSSGVYRRVGNALYDAGGYEVCDLRAAERDLAGWRWAVLGHGKEAEE